MRALLAAVCLELESRILFSAPLVAPALNSYPTATAELFLDFDGAPAGTFGGEPVPAIPAFDLDGNPNAFSTTELAAINEIWSRVAEAYSPFNINVTTVDPRNLWASAGQVHRHHWWKRRFLGR